MGPTSPADKSRKTLPTNDLIAAYLDGWNETDPAARRKLIDGTWAAGASYIDPLAEAHGRARPAGHLSTCSRLTARPLVTQHVSVFITG